jgi:hypothetical protein
MRKAFYASIVIFVISAFIGIVAIFHNMDFTNPIFDSKYDNSPYIGVSRNFLKAIEKLDVPDYFVTILSAISSYITYKKSH